MQPLFSDDRVVLAARTVPLADRVRGTLLAAVLAELSLALADVPLAGKPSADAGQSPFDWRPRVRGGGGVIPARLHPRSRRRPAACSTWSAAPPPRPCSARRRADRATIWALATLACLTSGDYRNAREPAPHLPVS